MENFICKTNPSQDDDRDWNAAKIYKNPNVSLTHTNKNKHTLRFELTEGKNREIRNICEIFNLKVERLKRISFGQYKVKSIPLSKYKEIIIHESN